MESDDLVMLGYPATPLPSLYRARGFVVFRWNKTIFSWMEVGAYSVPRKTPQPLSVSPVRPNSYVAERHSRAAPIAGAT